MLKIRCLFEGSLSIEIPEEILWILLRMPISIIVQSLKIFWNTKCEMRNDYEFIQLNLIIHICILLLNYNTNRRAFAFYIYDYVLNCTWITTTMDSDNDNDKILRKAFLFYSTIMLQASAIIHTKSKARNIRLISNRVVISVRKAL